MTSTRGLLWRVVFCEGRPDQPHLAGPWHADKARAQAWIDWFRSKGQCARLQSSAEAGKTMSTSSHEGGIAGRS